jgi:Cd2+/Zn2+-exporting ATPase
VGEHSHEQEHEHDHAHHDHGHSHGGEDEPGEVRREIILLAASALIFALTMIFTHAIKGAFGVWGLRVLYAIPYSLCGISIYRAAWQSMRRGDYLNEFSLMCGATVAAIILGELPEAVGVMLFYRIGEFFQDRASAGSRRSIRQLLASKPATAHVFNDGEWLTLPVENVMPGKLVQVRPGEKIPLDGEVIEGESQVDQSPLTGESVPVNARPGKSVYAGAVNLSGVIIVEVKSRFADSHVARILEMVENASTRKSATERFITRFARYYTPVVVALAFLVAMLPPLLISGAEFNTWVYRALVLLVISCPCALIISIPLSYFGGIGAASRKGMLVKGGHVLDGLLHVRTVVFDKTGTLTRGVFAVTELAPAPGVSEDELLRGAMLGESGSNHPIARSILAYARERGLPESDEVTSGGVQIREIPGKGMEAVAGGVRYLVGSASLLQDSGIAYPAAPDKPGALVYVSRGEQCLGYILVSDQIRDDSRAAVDNLRKAGLKSYMLTGDRDEAAAWTARELGLDGYRANLLPEGKVEALDELGGASSAAFVGDGINDAPILALSRVGIAMGGMGAEAAIEAADAVILNDSPSKVPELIQLARDVRGIAWQNIVLAVGVKVSFMALGVVGLSGLWEAVFADVGVALLAVLNSTRVLKK